MTGLPTEAEVARYRADGALCLRGAIPLDWIERLREAVDADMAAPGPMVRLNTPKGAPGLFFVDFQLWQRHDAARDFVHRSPAKEIAARLMGSREVVYYHDHLLVKEPGTQERTPWHHDQPYYPIDGEQIVSLWLPLDPVDRATCVEYVKGSHRWGRWFQPKFFRQGGVDLQVQDPRFEPLPDLDAERAILATDLENAGMVEAKYQVTGIGPTIAGHNGGGDLYYTDGEIWVLRLVEACKKREGPAVTIPSPPATELKDQIWRAIANVVGK